MTTALAERPATTPASAAPAHGTRARYRDGCRCQPCRRDNAAHSAHRRRMIAYGRPTNDFVDPARAREHIQALRESGMGIKRIAALSGVAYCSVRDIVHPARPSQKIRSVTEQKLLALTVVIADDASISGVGSRRRLQALVAIGWSMQRLAAELGWAHRNLWKLLNSDEMLYARNARAVTAVYDRLWDVAPPQDSRFERAAFVRSKRYAAARGWAVPMAWSDENLDDPTARPDYGHGRTGNAAENADLVAELAAQGLTPSEIVAKTGLSRSSVFRLRGKRAS